MAWLPGWDSAESAGWWSHLYFWFGIGCLFLLGASEIVSHVYSLRKDELVAASERTADEQRRHEQQQADDRHAEEGAAMREELANAQKDAREAKRQAARRQLTPAQSAELIRVLQPFAGQRITIHSISGDTESTALAEEFEATLKGAGWAVHRLIVIFSKDPVGFIVLVNDGDVGSEKIPKAGLELVDSCVELGLMDSRTLGKTPDIPAGEIGLTIGRKPDLR